MKVGSGRVFLLIGACLSASLVISCGAKNPSDPGPSQPAGWDAELRLPDAVDTNPDSHIFETTLTAKIANIEIHPGTVTPVWTYNGLLPGPMIRLARGDV